MTTEADVAKLQQFAMFTNPRLDKLEDDVSGLRVLVSLDSRVSDHENRLRQIEHANVKLAGLVSVLSTIGALGVQYLMGRLPH